MRKLRRLSPSTCIATTWLLPYWSEQPRGDRVAMYVNAAKEGGGGGGLAAGIAAAAITGGAGAAGAAGVWGSGGGYGVHGGGSEGEGEEEEPFDVSACHAPVTPKGQVPEAFGNKTYAGQGWHFSLTLLLRVKTRFN
jgi:hypothetical protein